MYSTNLSLIFEKSIVRWALEVENVSIEIQLGRGGSNE